MNYLNKLIKSITLLSLLFIYSNVNASEIGLIVASDNIKINKLSKNELENIFLGKTTILENGTHVNIAYSTQNSEKVNYFFKNYIEKSQRRFKKYWLKKVFAGYGIAPKIFKNNKLTIDYIKKHENVIAFITVDDKDTLEDVLIIAIDGEKSF